MADHGHSHGGQPCSGHGAGHEQHPPSGHGHGHGHSHGAVPCTDNGNGHGHVKQHEEETGLRNRKAVHLHGPDCGHVAIEHGTHIGFLVDGQMECFDSGGKTLSELCFNDHQEQATPDPEDCCASPDTGTQKHIHAHLRRNCDGPVEVIKLDRVKHSAPCALPISDILHSSCGETPVGDPNHVHGDGCGHDRIWHGDHMDYLVPSETGDRMELHHVHLCDDGSIHNDLHGEILCTSPLISDGQSEAKDEGVTKMWRFSIDVGVKRAEGLLGRTSDQVSVELGDLKAKDTTLFVEGICCPSEVPAAQCCLCCEVRELCASCDIAMCVLRQRQCVATVHACILRFALATWLVLNPRHLNSESSSSETLVLSVTQSFGPLKHLPARLLSATAFSCLLLPFDHPF